MDERKRIKKKRNMNSYENIQPNLFFSKPQQKKKYKAKDKINENMLFMLFRVIQCILFENSIIYLLTKIKHGNSKVPVISKTKLLNLNPREKQIKELHHRI